MREPMASKSSCSHKGAPAGAQPDDDGKTPEVEVVYISDLDIMFNAFLTVRGTDLFRMSPINSKTSPSC